MYKFVFDILGIVLGLIAKVVLIVLIALNIYERTWDEATFWLLLLIWLTYFERDESGNSSRY